MSTSDKLTRRNGREAACEPCRLRKVACDHTRPVCRRCHKRKQACRYLVSESSTAVSETAQPAPLTIAPVSSPTANEPLTGSLAPSRPGWFGYTSHVQVYDETECSLSALAGITPQQSREAAQAQCEISFQDLPRSLRETCLLVLRCLPGQANEQIRFKPEPAPSRGWVYIAVDRIIDSLQNEYGHVLNQGEAGLPTLAAILSYNTTKPFLDCHDPQKWIGQLYGSSLRWESIGLLWGHLSRSSDVRDSLYSRSIEWIDGKESLETARTCLSHSVEAAKQFTEYNDILVDLIRRLSYLSGILNGDAKLSSFSDRASGVAMLIYSGIHALEDNQKYMPSLCSENKRRLFAQVFATDKLAVQFTGRPPLISRRYSSTPLPLDISDEDLFSDQATLVRAIQALDARGWNTRGELYSSTVIRARCVIADIREDLMEIGLSNHSRVTINDLVNLKARQIEAVSHFPEGLCLQSHDLNNLTMDTHRAYIGILMRLDYLDNLFVIERLILRHCGADSGTLLATSFEMISLVLKLWTHKDRFAGNYILRNFEWLVMAYGAPGGGILCQELLEPTFTGAHPLNPDLTRSSIVQQLSLLVGFLDWVRPSGPNGDLCRDSKAIIQRVLDYHLSGSRAFETGQSQFPNTMDWDMAQPDFNFELLNTFDWLRDGNLQFRQL